MKIRQILFLLFAAVLLSSCSSNTKKSENVENETPLVLPHPSWSIINSALRPKPAEVEVGVTQFYKLNLVLLEKENVELCSKSINACNALARDQKINKAQKKYLECFSVGLVNSSLTSRSLYGISKDFGNEIQVNEELRRFLQDGQAVQINNNCGGDPRPY